MTVLLYSLWPLFALIVGGYLLRRHDFPGEAFWPAAERLNYFILFPALLFSSLATAPLDNPALPRLALQQVPSTRYAVRKAHAPHQLSTLEAAQCALQQLEPANPYIAALGQAMDALMALLRSRDGAARWAMLGPDLS